jgi:hypothetical protein
MEDLAAVVGPDPMLQAAMMLATPRAPTRAPTRESNDYGISEFMRASGFS